MSSAASARPAPNVTAALLQLARYEKNLSQRELAERAGVCQSVIARIESGASQPSIPTLQRILAGAGLELRLHLEPLDNHDDFLTERDRRRSKADRDTTRRRHESNVAKFSANATARISEQA